MKIKLTRTLRTDDPKNHFGMILEEGTILTLYQGPATVNSEEGLAATLSGDPNMGPFGQVDYTDFVQVSDEEYRATQPPAEAAAVALHEADEDTDGQQAEPPAQDR